VNILIRIPCFSKRYTLPLPVVNLPRSWPRFELVKSLVIDGGAVVLPPGSSDSCLLRIAGCHRSPAGGGWWRSGDLQALAYFNELVGGPANGHRHLLGSNVDWGQDRLRLKRWLDVNLEAHPLRFAYFNHVDPRIIGIEIELPPLGVVDQPPSDPEEAARLGPQPGWYTVSARLAGGAAGGPPDGHGGYSAVPFRGYAWFLHFRPVARAGWSIFIYHITPEEANAVRREYGLPPLP
jgi:hypothetical protein